MVPKLINTPDVLLLKIPFINVYTFVAKKVSVDVLLCSLKVPQAILWATLEEILCCEDRANDFQCCLMELIVSFSVILV